MEASTNYDILITKIEDFIRKYYLNKVLRGMLFVVAALFFSFLFILLVEYLGNFSSTIRSILFFGYWILNGALFCLLVLPPLLSYLNLGKVISHDEAAKIIGVHFSHVKDKLLNTLQLKRIADNNPSQRQLINASIDQKISTLKPVSFPSAVRIRQNIKYIKWILFPLGIIILLAMVFPAILKENTQKIIQHDRVFVPRAPFEFVVANATLSVVQGEDLQIQVKLEGNHFPENIYIETAKNAFKMKKESISRFSYTLTNLQQDLSFQLMGNDFKSKEYHVKVSPKPSLLNFDAELKYPAYLNRKNEYINNAGDLTIPVGTLITWHVRTKNANTLFLGMDGKYEQLKSSNDNFSKSIQAIQSGNYSLRVISDKVPWGDSVSYQMHVIPDEKPGISVNEKRDSVSAKAIYFNGQAQDDHGISSLIFHCAITSNENQSPRIIELPVKADLGQTETAFFHFWDLNELKLNPGDRVSYYFQVTDNNAVTGRQIARTEERTLELPTENEMLQQLNADAGAVKNKMQEAINLSRQMDKDIEKLNQLLLNKTNLSYDDKKQIQDLLNKRQELKRMIEEAQQQNQQNMLNRQEYSKGDQDLQEKQNQMDNLMKDLLDPKTDDMIKKLQDLLENKTENPPAKELANMKMNDRELSQQLDRTLELMKQLDVNRQVKENIDRLNSLAEKQQQLAEQTKQNGADAKTLMQKQDNIRKELDDVKKSLADAAQRNEQLDNKLGFENPKPELNKIDDQLSKSFGDLAQGRLNEANVKQQDAARQMQQLAQSMANKLNDDAMQDIVISSNNLKSLIKKLVESSFDQENVIEKLKAIKPDDPSYPTWIQKQKYIQSNMQTMRDSLIALSKRLLAIETTVLSETNLLNQNIEQAIQYLSDRRTTDANRSQQLAMTSMNNLALMLSETLTKMQDALKQDPKNGGGGGGARSRRTLLELSEMQQKLNANMQAMRQKMQQQGPQQGKVGDKSPTQGEGGPMSEQFARMARQQSEIRQSIERINREENKDGRGSLGDLDRLAKDMERTETDLVNKRINEATLSRQLQIRTRLLEAEKADQEREQDNKRESRAPQKNYPPGLVQALREFEQEKVKQTEQLRTTPATLNDYYKTIVTKYFEQVGKKE